MKRKKLLLIFVFTIIPLVVGTGDAKNLTYSHKDPGFSFVYPGSFKARPLLSKTEVARFSPDNIYKLPVMVAHVRDKKGSYKAADLPGILINRLRSLVPEAAGFKVFGQKDVTLYDGNKAHLFKIKWMWIQGLKSIPLETVSVTVLNKDKIVSLTCTVPAGQKLLDKMLPLCFTLHIVK